jgi:shikimate kinase
MQNIVLIGFMGCGKSTIGWELHKSLAYPFIDTDPEIEKLAGKKITRIFEEEGEAAFRDMETQYLQKLIDQNTQKSIISTGGGITTTPENIPLLRQLGFVVWLTCSPESIYERTSRNNNRPLLQCENPHDAITSLLAKREPLYAASAHLRINSSDLSIHEITYGILESARYHFSIPDNLPEKAILTQSPPHEESTNTSKRQ